jgi:DNA-binding NtrC family response regulator
MPELDVRQCFLTVGDRTLDQLKVVVVDDDEGSREILRLIISKTLGHRVFTASDGKEALGIIKVEVPDIVITDFMMTKMNGVELIEKIRSLGEPYEKIEVILISAYGSMETYLDAMNLGAFEIINKPFHASAIERIIRKLTESKGN